MKIVLKSIIATTFSLSLFAAPKSQPQAPQIQDPNPLARFGTSAKQNVFMALEAQWLQPFNEITVQTNDTINNKNDNETHKYFRNVYQPAVKATLGYNTSYDGWDAQLVYTYFNYSHKESYFRNYTDAKSRNEYVNVTGIFKYEIQMNLGDLDFGRMFSVSKRLKLRPHAGVRGLWLRQKGDMKLNDYVLEDLGSREYRTFSSTLFGLEGGLDLLWVLGKGISIYTNGGIAGLINSQQLVDHFYDAKAGLEYRVATNHGTTLVCALDFAMGLRWDKNLYSDKYHIGINLGYEQHGYINLLTNTTKDVGTLWDLVGTDFGWQGFGLGMRFDF
jgi:hypothetical protein